MYNFSFCSDPYLVIQATTAPNNFKWCYPPDFSAPEIPGLNDNLTYIECYKEGLFLGCFIIEDMTEIHTALLPIAWGETVNIGIELMDWVRENTNISTLITLCSTQNRLVTQLTKRVGFRLVGRSEKTQEIDGIVHVFDIYGINL
jgi:RimJ/RimL family protein N-acetyltransferase